MNESGKLKHRARLLIFKRGSTPQQDTLVAHVVTTKARFRTIFRRECRRYDRTHVAWAVDEPYWRQHGMKGRPL